MFTDAYTTTPCLPYRNNIEGIKKEIKISVTLGEDNPFRLSEFGVGRNIMALTGPDKDIPAFAHPLSVPGRESGFFEDTVVFDARGFVRVALDGTVTIQNQEEFALHALRARLTRYVLANHYANLSAVGSFPLEVFVNWLSQLITSRLSIDPGAQQRTQAIIAIYYLSLFKDVNELTDLSDSTIGRYAQMINRLFRIDAELVVGLLRTLPPITSIIDLIMALKDHGGSIRFENLNIGILLTIAGGSWFGYQAKEVVAVALEHPPTWIALVATSLTTNTYRKTAIGEKVKSANKSDIGKDYLHGLYKLPGLKGD